MANRFSSPNALAIQGLSCKHFHYIPENVLAFLKTIQCTGFISSNFEFRTFDYYFVWSFSYLCLLLAWLVWADCLIDLECCWYFASVSQIFFFFKFLLILCLRSSYTNNTTKWAKQRNKGWNWFFFKLFHRNTFDSS